MTGTCRGYEDSSGIGRELQLAAAAPTHLVAFAPGGGLHCERRICGQALVSSRPIDDVWTQADAAEAVVLEVDLRGPFVRQLEDPVQRRRLTRIRDTRPRARTVDGSRTRVGDAANALSLGRLEDVCCSHDVHGGPAGRIGFH